MPNYYTYIYLDPRKSGHYKYLGVVFDYEPFYVGKGSSVRWYPSVHVGRPRSEYLTNKLKKIGLNNVIKLKLIDNLLESDAFLFEQLYIKIIGRKCVGKGPLINFTEGGTGMSPSKETREKISKTLKSKNISAWNKGKPWPKKIRRKMSKAAIGRKLSEETKRKISEFNKGRSVGENAHNVKLTSNEVLLIRKLYVTGKYLQRELAEQFKVKETIISRIVRRKVWKHI